MYSHAVVIFAAVYARDVPLYLRVIGVSLLTMATWYFINGCPLLEDCNRRLTVKEGKHMKFYGVNEKECRWRLAHHLSHSDLHKLPDAEAIQIAGLAKVDCYVESTIRSKRPRCDEHVANLRPRTPSPPPTKHRQWQRHATC